MGIETNYLHIENRSGWMKMTLSGREKRDDKLKYSRFTRQTRYKLSISTGFWFRDIRNARMTNAGFYHADTGSRCIAESGIWIIDCHYSQRLTVLYLYVLLPEKNWTNYNHDFSDKFRKFCVPTMKRYFRICIRKRWTEHWRMKPGMWKISCIWDHERQYEKGIFRRRDTAIRTKRCCAVEKLTLGVIADYVVGGTWKDTAHQGQFHRQAGFEAGLFIWESDGQYGCQELTKQYAERVLGDLRRIAYTTIVWYRGNHDSNYFSCREPMNDEEQQALSEL